MPALSSRFHFPSRVLIGLMLIIISFSIVLIITKWRGADSSLSSADYQISNWLVQQPDHSTHSFFLGSREYRFEVANSAHSRERGLSGRQSIGSDGLLLVFPENNYYGIWMKEMLFDIDIIWIQGGKVVDITTGVRAPVKPELTSDLQIFYPSVAIDLVLEMPAGMVSANQIQTGDVLKRKAG